MTMMLEQTSKFISIALLFVHCIRIAHSLSLNHQYYLPSNYVFNPLHCNAIARRDVLRTASTVSTAAIIATTGSLLTSHPSPCYSAENDTTTTTTTTAVGLARRLSLRDPSQLKNSVFNIPPKAQVYPDFLRGEWDVTMKYRGFLFPSTSIPKDKLISNVSIPGFQKLSIAQIADVGREQPTTYQMSIDPTTGFEDRSVSISTSINAHLGYDAVRNILYNRKDNPNRISIDFIPNRTRNANRIELFCNARESEFLSSSSNNPSQEEANESSSSSSAAASAVAAKIFVCSEHIRQVTFGLSQEFGVARQVVGNYAHFWTWKEEVSNNDDDEDPSKSTVVTGNLLTAAYLDAQDALFFDEPSKPVVVYSHDLVAKKRS